MAVITEQAQVRAVAPISDAEADGVLRVRYWMHLLNEMLKQKQFNIPIHLGFGNEAAAVAMDRTLQPDDVLCLTHRNAAYNLARGRSLDVVLGHYRLQACSPLGASMGSMNLATEGTGIMYSSSILGNNLAVGAGIALSRRLRAKPGIVFALTGDGGMEEGVFWESLIFAKSHRLGIVFVLENNNHSMSSTIEQRRFTIDLAKVCDGLGIPYRRAFGAEIGGVRAALSAARSDAAAGSPAFVELDLTMFNQHAGPTPGWPTDSMQIDLANGLMLKESPDDPIFHVKQALGTDEYARRVDAIVKAANE